MRASYREFLPQDELDRRLLHLAGDKRATPEAVVALLHAGANPNARGTTPGDPQGTVLARAVHHGQATTTATLIEHGAVLGTDALAALETGMLSMAMQALSYNAAGLAQAMLRRGWRRYLETAIEMQEALGEIGTAAPAVVAVVRDTRHLDLGAEVPTGLVSPGNGAGGVSPDAGWPAAAA